MFNLAHVARNKKSIKKETKANTRQWPLCSVQVKIRDMKAVQKESERHGLGKTSAECPSPTEEHRISAIRKGDVFQIVLRRKSHFDPRVSCMLGLSAGYATVASHFIVTSTTSRLLVTV